MGSRIRLHGDRLFGRATRVSSVRRAQMGKSCFVKRVIMVVVPTRLYAFFGKRSMLCEKYGWVARKVEGKGGTGFRFSPE